MTVAPAPVTAGQLGRRIAKRLEQAFAAEGRAGTPALDARLIVAHAAGQEANTLAIYDALSCSPEVEARAVSFAERRIGGEPVSRILGEKEFWGLPFRLSRDTLVPRPDTETVVAAALASVD